MDLLYQGAAERKLRFRSGRSQFEYQREGFDLRPGQRRDGYGFRSNEPMGIQSHDHAAAQARWTYLMGVLTGVAGSRLWYFLQYGDPSLRGGLSSWGFMIGATLGCGAWLRFSHGRWAFREFGRFFDAIAPAIAFGSALTRLACFHGGCNFGKPADLPWAVHYGPGTPAFVKQIETGLIHPASALILPIHPTQLYEATALLVAFVLILWSPKRLFSRVLTGELFLGLAIYYGTFRFVVEFLRDDASGVRFGALTFAQATSVGVVLISVLAILQGRSRLLPYRLST